ncbi:response regulator transcription factor [Microbulbifer elongatus]|uniref:Response regulator transcription factor n=1 Tax=Microbulbifer elongatus TaxID=86173 RepID=A0ABT1NW85_9GAMM|nr:response regulator transcription factor [Microbulbifer elongatus]MCQ3828162.1 response regulator transcription factor [Microbulbifer elongatus]
MNGKRILLIEDDQRLARSVVQFLEKQQFVVRHLADGIGVSQLLRNEVIDLVLCDIMLPGRDGFEIIEEVRREFTGPCLFLTASSDVPIQLKAFDAGADDFIVKPVHPDILLARIHACLRRNFPPTQKKSAIQIDNLRIDRSGRKAWVNDELIALSPGEFDLLWLLVSNPQQPLSREFLFINSLGRRYDGLDRTIDGRISRLRKKMERHASLLLTVRTVWGKGYMLAERL